MSRFRQSLKSLRNFALVLVLATWQLAIPIGSLIKPDVAYAVSNCVVDTAGANDEPGQKDLNKLCVDEAGLPTSEHVTWNWDETGTPGANTLDGCALFDTDGDGNINYSLCVTTAGNPATLSLTTLYSCGDAKIDRCTSPTTPQIITGGTACTVSQPANSDPFPGPPNSAKGDSYPLDTVADCNIAISDVGGVGVAKLIDVCSYPSQQPNSDPSDCVILQPKSGKVEVVKHLVPTTDSGLFNLQVDGTTKAANVGNNGTTGEQVLPDGNHSVGETQGTNTLLSSYNSAIECKDQNGQGTVVAHGTGTSLDNVPVADGSDIVCIITNTRQTGTITLIKSVTNNNGGTAGANDFGLSIGGTPVTSGQTLTLNPGSYAINEAGLTGYSFVSLTGTGCPSSLGGNVTLADNQNVTCTITNDDIAPQLTVIKHVINDNGGGATASNFTMNVTGTNVSTSSFAGAENPGTTVTLNAGSYSVDEGSHTGYTKTLGQNCNGSIALGEHKTCTITNDDIAPILTLIKYVTKDNGGTAAPTDWNLSATPSDSQYSTLSGAGGFASKTAQANVGYALAESTGPSGYSAGSWNCNGGTFANNSLTLAAGDNVTCSITNNDIAPRLTVTKVVTNNDGGTLQVSDFPLYVDNTQVTSGVEYTSFNAGTYTVSEVQQAGYNLDSITGNCSPNGSITMVVGGVYSCTLTNNDIPATITVTKVVNNNHGGTAGVSDFDLFVSTTKVTNGASNTFAANQQYTVSELAKVDGYQQSSLTCTDTNTHASLGDTFTPTLGENIACTITNGDVAPQLTVIKHVVNNSGGTAVASDFTMHVTGTNVSTVNFAGAENPGTTVTLNAGSYTADESNFAGYAKTLGQNCSGTIALGEQKTCVITNTDIAPTIKVNKEIVSSTTDNGLFNLNINGPANSSTPDQGDGGTTGTVSVVNGDYTVSETGGTNTDLSDYSSTYDCDNGTKGSGTTTTSFTVGSGDSVTCTFTNTRLGSVTIVKDAQPDSDQAFGFVGDLGQFSLTDNSTNSESQTFTKLSEGTYTVTEPGGVKGWTLDSVTCEGGSDTDTHNRNAVIKLQPGENVTCTFVNTRDRANVIVHKLTSQPSNDSFDINLRDSNDQNALTHNSNLKGGETDNYSVVTGTYTIGEENLPAGWDLSDATCTNSNIRDEGQDTFDPRTSGSFDLDKNGTLECTFTNHRAVAVNIAKTNDRPDATTTGDTVTYTLTVTVPETSGTVFDAAVTDLPPDNFAFVPGSWTATSSNSGHNVALDVIDGGGPSYGSPGIWHLGTLTPGEIVTLTYKAIIGSSVSDGTYPDLAFVTGSDALAGGHQVIGNLAAATPFVSSQVKVASALVPANFTAGQVLGAEVLVNTGARLSLAQFILPVALISAVYFIRRVNRYQEKGGK
ncbi:MAG TPA: hypothetical protein VLG37_04155 [Candidatus Saccharimonadales bacterium]|nr:hypothetical protein [Candidatus Saccharimonadales bacterium]